MSYHLLVMLIFINIRLKSKFMIYSSSLNPIEDCFYEKRIDTSLNGYNDLHDRWVSELDCLDRCLKTKPQPCRSFEYWRSNRHGLCVRANVSLTDQPSSMGTNLFVDYYEIDCRKDTKAVRSQTITCPGDELHVVVTLNGIDPNYVLLGDSNCKPVWSNETHAQFMTHVDNCSLVLNEGSIVGKLRWEGVDKDSNEARQYERFFLCPSDIHQIRLAHWTSTTVPPPPTTSLSEDLLPLSTTRHRLSSHIYHDQQPITATYRILLQWILHDRTYHCPPLCAISLYSFIHVKFNDLSSKFLIDSCDFIARYPYEHYLQTRRLIYRGCSTDPTVIHLSTFDYSFYLYNLLKEPIPFEIQCKILLNHNEQRKDLLNSTNCSIENEQFLITKKDLTYVLFRSSPIDVHRQLPKNFSEINKLHVPNSFTPMIAVHHIECFLFVFSFIVHWTF